MEVCCFSTAAALAAWQAGAQRIELCSERDLDGITPDPALLSEVRRLYGNPNASHNTDGETKCPKLFVMLRPRPRHAMSTAFAIAATKNHLNKERTFRNCLDGTCGSWHCAAASLFQLTPCETEEELVQTLSSFPLQKDDNSGACVMAPVEGVVFGALKAVLQSDEEDSPVVENRSASHVQWSVDLEAMQRIATAAQSVGIRDVTFHRAFDFINCFTSPPRSLPNSTVTSLLQQVSECLEFLVSACGITRILTSSPFCYFDISSSHDDSVVGVSVNAPASKVIDHISNVALLVKAARELVREECAASLLTIVLAGGVNADTIERLKLAENGIAFHNDGELVVEFHGSFLVFPDQMAPEVDAVRRAVLLL